MALSAQLKVLCFFVADSEILLYLYMLSLRAKNKKKAPATKNGKSKEDGEDDNDEDVAAGEKKALSDLETKSRKCMCCGPTVMCKIDRTGNHVHLTFLQRRA
ncbi:hypothetical protein DFH08DRAFT_812274 [Mycena albidolilacea]|uniref:Uncharacterized protein n=1 Tax=Mycena albidolilacea TaxID=1033008 RepID=A0AAD6ZUB1_9AGAR|nr:hypothetical protein DFH08DRAFT_812274 [Mycena albidolilacea]